jgi:phenylpropionate dioxygenase-like ring-hydroxylating dioxygenase large terminal subunit
VNANPKYLMNTWYVAALSREIEAGKLFSRKILGTSIVMYRRTTGEPVAMRDRCPHRFAPLSLGTLVDDEVTCLYHGLKFDCTGKCTHNPHGKGKIPSTAHVRSFPLVERDGFLWIWPGDPAKVDESLIMDCSILNRNPASSVAYAHMHNEANYELLADNIMDLSHIDHLHGPLINTRGKLSPLMPQVEKEADDVRIRWEWHANPAMLMLAENLSAPEASAEQFFEVRWHAPSNLYLQVGAVQNSEDYYEDGVVSHAYHIMTPETATSSHYFYASTRNFRMDDEEYNSAKLENIVEVFATEDKPVIEAQQLEMGGVDLWEQKPALLSCDAGAVQVRRTLQAMIEAEQQAVAA